MCEILKSALRKSLTDIYQIGLIDDDESTLELMPSYLVFFLEFDESLLIKLLWGMEDLKIYLSEVDSIELNENVTQSEGYQSYKTSIKKLVLDGEDLQNIILSIDIFNLIEFSDGRITCDSISFKLDNGQELFFDPIDLHGLTFGGISKRKKWIGKFSGNIDKHVLK